MSFFSTIRERRSRRTRGALGVLIGLWLNFALLPCAMAFDTVEDHQCPHCPPAHSTEHGDHGMSAHASETDQMPCSTGASDCSLVDDFKHDGRNVQLKLKDIPGDVPLVLPPPLEQRWSAQAAAHVACGPGRSPPPGHQIPLNILYCVYLD